MQWFLFRGIILHIPDNIKTPEDHLQLLLKLLSMLKIIIWYYEGIIHENVPDSVGIMCINCEKCIGCLLDNQGIEKFITPFVTNMVFRNVGLYWTIQSNQKLNFDLQNHCLYWIINGPMYNTTICSQLHGLVFEYYVETDRRDQYNIICSIEAHERKHNL